MRVFLTDLTTYAYRGGVGMLRRINFYSTTQPKKGYKVYTFFGKQYVWFATRYARLENFKYIILSLGKPSPHYLKRLNNLWGNIW